MKIIIYPHHAIQLFGQKLITFGMSRQEVRQCFPYPPQELEFGNNSPVDLYLGMSLRCHYDTRDQLISVDIFYNQTCSLFLGEFNLFSTSFSRVQEIIEAFAQEAMVENNTGIWVCESFGLMVYNKLYDNNWLHEPVDMISVSSIFHQSPNMKFQEYQDVSYPFRREYSKRLAIVS
jgi:hypothetical protein